MHLEHFNLRSDPFAIAPDPAFLIWTPQHQRAFEILAQESLAGAPLTLLTGGIGCGKSTLVQALLQDPRIETHHHAMLISHGLGSAEDLLQHLHLSLYDSLPPVSDEDITKRISDGLARKSARKVKPLLIVDEAQKLSADAARLLVELAKGELFQGQCVSVLLSGQPELADLVKEPEMQPLFNMISEHVRLGPISLNETDEFIQGRLETAGYVGNPLFDARAVRTIHAYSKGTPRLINKLCELCLFTAAQQGCRVVTNSLVTEVIQTFAPPAPVSTTPIRYSEIYEEKAQAPPAAQPTPPPRPPARPKIATPIPVTASPPLPAPVTVTLPAMRETDVANQRPIRQAFGFVIGGSVALLCTVPLLRFLPSPGEPQIVTVARTPKLSPSDTFEKLQSAQQELEALTQSIALAQAEKQALQGTLSQMKIDRDRVFSSLIAASTQLEDLRQEINLGQGQLASHSQDIADADVTLTALRDHAEAPEEIVARSVHAPQEIGPVVPLRADPSPARRLEPLLITGEDPSAFYSAALESSDATEIAVNYARAALRGHSRAALYLGQLFETGDGVMFDADIAQRWYQVSENKDNLHHPSLTQKIIDPASQSVSPMAVFLSGGKAEFVWQGRAEGFTVELANMDEKAIAFAQTPLTALQIDLPEHTTYWRVSTDSGASFDWQPLK